MIEVKLNLSSFLNKEMKENKLSLTKLAKELAIPKTILHSWLNGTPPTLNEKNLRYLQKIAGFFNVSTSRLILDHKENEPTTTVIMESIFRDGTHRYRLKIEKISE